MWEAMEATNHPVEYAVDMLKVFWGPTLSESPTTTVQHAASVGHPHASACTVMNSTSVTSATHLYLHVQGVEQLSYR